jgi:hypothetical protein
MSASAASPQCPAGDCVGTDLGKRRVTCQGLTGARLDGFQGLAKVDGVLALQTDATPAEAVRVHSHLITCSSMQPTDTMVWSQWSSTSRAGLRALAAPWK